MEPKCPDKLIMGHLDTNSIRNKFDALSLIVKNNVAILMISETKLDDSFPTAQFLLHGFSTPYRLNRNSKGGGMLLYIREGIPSRFLNSKSKTGIETISVETNLGKGKWILNCSYNPNKNLISNHLECLNRIMDEFSKNYDNVNFLGDFNTCINDNAMASFCSINNLTSLIDQPTCYKNPDKPTCIDSMLTNRPNYFQQNNVSETGLSKFHMMVVTELKMGFQKLKPHIVAYRNYKHFDNENFRSDIQNCTSEKNLKYFKETVFCIFNKHAPIKRKYAHANKVPFMAKELHKAIMKRSRLRNKFLKTKSITDRKNYNVQRNYCKKLLRSTKKSYFNDLDTSKINDNRSFWKTIVPLFSKKKLKKRKNLPEWRR